MRAAIYARVSSREQQQLRTIDSQLRELPAYAERQGWRVVGTYVDDGRSASAGKLEQRTGFSRLLADARAGRFDVLVAVDMSRLTRTDSWRERGEILGALQDAGVRVAFMATGQLLDLRAGVGDIMAGLTAAIAAEDQRRRTEAFMRGVREAVARGAKARGATPYGLTWAKGARPAAGRGTR
jgi:DNA invertase Pin-like site-specific DNA recombinase